MIMHNLLRFGLRSLLAVQLALGVGLYGARALHVVPMLTHGVGPQTDLPSGMRELETGPSSMLSGIKLNGITALSAHNIWAVGYYFHDIEISQALIEHWDGTHWSIVPSPDPNSTFEPSAKSVLPYFDTVGEPS